MDSEDVVNTPMLEEDLAPLNAQIEKVRKKQKAFQDDLSAVEAELERLDSDKQKFDALRNVCDALDKLKELELDELFWEGIAEAQTAAEHVERTRGRIAALEEEVVSVLEKQHAVQKEIEQCDNELSILYDDVSEVYQREEERKDAYVVEREISPAPYRMMVMPWTREAESERIYRRSVSLALLLCFVFSFLFSMIKVPIPDRSTTEVKIPKRLVQLVKKEALKPKPLPKKVQKKLDETQEKPELAKKETKPKEKKSSTEPSKKKVAAASIKQKAAARKKAVSVGVLAFKDSFKDLLKETSVPKLGSQARLNQKTPSVRGGAVPSRSLVAMQAKSGSSGGINNATVNRNIGNSNVDRLGGDGVGNGLGLTRVTSNISNLEESARADSDGLVSGRTDEEIQIVFDRYKATLYRIYNKELRKDPTLRGKILMRITIEPDGSVSMCGVESTDLDSPELVKKIVERTKKINFGSKEGIQKVTILYPIDFLPA